MQYFKAIDCETGDFVACSERLETALAYAQDYASLAGRIVRVQDQTKRVHSLVRPD